MIGESKPYLLSSDEVSSINELLMSEGQPSLCNNNVTTYQKAKIKGKIFTSTKYTREKRQNNYTISFCNTAVSNGFGKIEMFICAGNAQIAVVKNFIVQTGIPHNIPVEVITDKTKQLLFEDYFTCTEERTIYIFVHHIVDKCINLSTDFAQLITLPLNNIETE